MKTKHQKPTDRAVTCFATMCCWHRVNNDELDHAAVKCAVCNRPAVVVTFQATPQFADAIYDAIRVNTPKAALRMLGPGWRQITPWQSLDRHLNSMERLWYEYGADASAVVLARYLTSFALFARQVDSQEEDA